jgi:sugar/nucleoside kinase (ribokinase family)
MSGRILVVGDIITDIVAVHSGNIVPDSDTAARITTTGGGSAANTAAWLAHQGVAVDLLSVVGLDLAGEERVAELTEAGVGCDCVVWSRSSPTGTIIVLTDGRHRSFLTDRGANRELQPSDVDDALESLPDVVHVHLSGYTLLDEPSRPAGVRVLSAAAERGLTTSVDAASAEPLRQAGADRFLDWVRGVDLLLANVDEARILAGLTAGGDAAGEPSTETHPGGPDRPPRADDSPEAVARALAHALAAGAAGDRGGRGDDGDTGGGSGPDDDRPGSGRSVGDRSVGGRVPEVVVKLGPAGAVWARGDEVRSVPAVTATVVDTTGAGDAFAAGLLAARLAGADVDAALAAAVRLGAVAVGLVGGRPPVSDRASS